MEPSTGKSSNSSSSSNGATDSFGFSESASLGGRLFLAVDMVVSGVSSSLRNVWSTAKADPRTDWVLSSEMLVPVSRADVFPTISRSLRDLDTRIRVSL